MKITKTQSLEIIQLAKAHLARMNELLTEAESLTDEEIRQEVFYIPSSLQDIYRSVQYNNGERLSIRIFDLAERVEAVRKFNAKAQFAPKV